MFKCAWRIRHSYILETSVLVVYYNVGKCCRIIVSKLAFGSYKKVWFIALICTCHALRITDKPTSQFTLRYLLLVFPSTALIHDVHDNIIRTLTHSILRCRVVFQWRVILPIVLRCVTTTSFSYQFSFCLLSCRRFPALILSLFIHSF